MIMESDAFTGFVILIGTFSIYALVLMGCMERQIKRVNKVLLQDEEDSKYVN
jgi:hypothetical protein